MVQITFFALSIVTFPAPLRRSQSLHLAELQRQLQQFLLVFRDILPHRSFHMPRLPVFCSAPILPRRGRIYNRLAKNTEKSRIFVRNVL